MHTPSFPFSGHVNQILADLQRAVKEESTSDSRSLVPLVVRDLALVVDRNLPQGSGESTLSSDQWDVFCLWEEAMAQALGLSRSDAQRVIGQMKRAARRRESDVEAESLSRLLEEVADQWIHLSSAERKKVERHVRDATNARMLGFANGFVQNELVSLPSEWLSLAEALSRCLAVRIVEEVPGKLRSPEAWKRALGPLSEESIHGARVAVEYNMRQILKILRKLVDR